MTSQFPPATGADQPEASRPRREPTLKRHTSPTGRRIPLWGLIAAGVAVLAIAVVAVLLLSGGDDTVKVEPGKPRVVSADELSSYAKSANHTVFWAGPAASGFKLELTEVRGPRVFVRYLSKNAQAGDPRAAFTTVATYPMANALSKIRAATNRPGAVVSTVPGTGVMTLYYKKTPSNVYVARPGSNFLVEVFAPQPRAALELAGSSQLVQVR
jgi:hypothetical protein